MTDEVKKNDKREYRFHVRMPRELEAEILKIAEAQRRSRNWVIVEMVKAGVQAYGKKSAEVQRDLFTSD